MSDPALHDTLRHLLEPTSPSQVGLILCERLINMPVQVIPPMYRMLTDEIKWAIDDVRSWYHHRDGTGGPQCDMHRTNPIHLAISCSFPGYTGSRPRRRVNRIARLRHGRSVPGNKAERQQRPRTASIRSILKTTSSCRYRSAVKGRSRFVADWRLASITQRDVLVQRAKRKGWVWTRHGGTDGACSCRPPD